jgi:2,3-dihydroxybenzoate-AMP ligase
MLPGVAFAGFRARDRAKGYWQDKSLAEEFSVVFRQFQDRTRSSTARRYATGVDEPPTTWHQPPEPACRSTAADPAEHRRVVPLYFAPRRSAPSDRRASCHRFAEINQSVQPRGAACFYPERQGDFASSR